MRGVSSFPMLVFNEVHESLDELAKTKDIVCSNYAIVCVLGQRALECNRLHSFIAVRISALPLGQIHAIAVIRKEPFLKKTQA